MPLASFPQATSSTALVLVCTQHIMVGCVGQWVIKPLLGLVLALTLVPMLGLPNAVGTGLILVRTPAVAALSSFYPPKVSPPLIRAAPMPSLLGLGACRGCTGAAAEHAAGLRSHRHPPF